MVASPPHQMGPLSPYLGPLVVRKAPLCQGAQRAPILRQGLAVWSERPLWGKDAYELYQCGMWHHYRQNKADNAEAQAHFRRALAIELQYPQATAALAIALLNAGFLGWAESAEANFAAAYELGQRAIRLDGRYPNAHFAFGLVCMWTSRSDRAITAFEEAIRLNPSFAAAHVMLGQMYLYAGRRQVAIERAEKGIRLSPSDPRNPSVLPAPSQWSPD